MDLSLIGPGGQLTFSGALSEGPAAVGQRLLVVLLTDSTDPLRESEGTSLRSLLDGGCSGYSNEVLTQLVTLALDSAATIIRDSQTEDTPASNRLKKVSIDSVSFQNLELSIVITVTTADGASDQLGETIHV